MEGYIVKEELATIAHTLTQAKYAFVSKSLWSRDDMLHLSNYIVLKLMRQGKLNLGYFEFMKQQYWMLDQRVSWLRGVSPD